MPTCREAVRQAWVDHNLRTFLGIDPMRIEARATGHADLHCDRTQIIQAEYFTRLTPGPAKGDPARLTI